MPTSGYLSGPALAQRLRRATPPASTGCAPASRAFGADAAQHFYLPERYTDPFGNVTTLDYDAARSLRPRRAPMRSATRTEVTRVRLPRARAARRCRTSTATCSEVRFDVLGHAGRDGGERQERRGRQPQRASTTRRSTRIRRPWPRFFVTTDYDAARRTRLLGSATHAPPLPLRRESSRTARSPGGSTRRARARIMRERHAAARSPGQPAAGRVRVLRRQRHRAGEEGPGRARRCTSGPLRWIASGKTILNNKGKPVKQYEPYFSPPAVGHRFEEPRGSRRHADACTTTRPGGWSAPSCRTAASAASSSRPGTSRTLRRRTTRCSKPRQRPGTRGMSASGRAHAERRARAWLAAAHADTPALTLLDSLGRDGVIAIAHNRVEDAPDQRTDDKHRHLHQARRRGQAAVDARRARQPGDAVHHAAAARRRHRSTTPRTSPRRASRPATTSPAICSSSTAWTPATAGCSTTRRASRCSPGTAAASALA